MLTFCEDEKTLFPCDFFGCHLASSKFYDEEFGDEIVRYAKGYYGEIMMPFSKMVGQALDKIEDLDIEVIAPSHGPVYKNPQRIVSSYRDGSEGKVRKKVLLVYLSMWGSAEKMAKTVFDTIASEQVEIQSLNLASTSLGKLAEEV